MEFPKHEANATFRANDRTWTLHESRIFPQSRERVWEAITEPDLVAQWAPFRPERPMTSEGILDYAPTDGSEAPAPSEIRQVIPGESLTFMWGDDAIKLDVLQPESGEGTLLGLSHTFADRNMGSSFAAGWHICLGALEMLLAGKPVPHVVGMDAMEYGYEDLNAAYAQQLDAQVGGNTTHP